MLIEAQLRLRRQSGTLGPSLESWAQAQDSGPKLGFWRDMLLPLSEATQAGIT